MIYKLKFLESALKEWNNLDDSIKNIFKKKLSERLKKPRIESAKLFSMPNCYKIKLKKFGYRLVYRVNDNEIIITVVVVGKREKGMVYKKALERLKNYF